MEKIGILTSGGDAPGMNAFIRSVVRTSIYRGAEVYGIKNGYKGLLEGKVDRMVESSVGDIIQRGGTILGTSRSDKFMTEEGIRRALSILEVFGITKLIVAGGDGSLKGALELGKRGVDVIGAPLSIDNDLGYTDYSIGFFTAVNTVTSAISKIRDTTESHGRAHVVEVMGRNCGDIALYSGLASGAESIIVPERKLNLDDIVKRAIKTKERGKRHHIIIMAEGAGSSYDLAEKFSDLTQIETKVTVLGYLQRGGEPNVIDRIMGSTMGEMSVNHIMDNLGSYAIGNKKGEIKIYDLEEALSVKKEFKDNLADIMKVISI
ncbi:ATP-dependent 6-phosphofructokinase [Peptoniphilus catoniae]|uniref:ATP-dependent 6-phosphofructokinase n=1 Tax=Peptoniphilus catoniae TaxID=1660341 RepID=UPI0010FE4FAD|nr:ATP-dependent 6-phosphofructokinase [Peptoniphilus catoniae]